MLVGPMSSVTRVYMSACVYRVRVLSNLDCGGLLRWHKCDARTDREVYGKLRGGDVGY